MKNETGFLGKDEYPFVRMGQGPVVVVLDALRVEHGPLTGPGLMGFRNTFAEFSQDFTLVHLGRKKNLSEACTLANIAQDLGSILEREFPEGVHLLGSGLGGGLAIHLAAEYPLVIRSVVTHSWGPHLTSEGQALFQELLDLSAEGQWSKVHRAMARWMFTRPWSRWLGASFASLFAEDLGTPTSAWDFQVMVQAVIAEDSRPLGPLINQRVLSFLGDRDPLYDVKGLRGFIEKVPHGRMEILQKTAHGVGKSLKNGIWDQTFQFFKSSGR